MVCDYSHIVAVFLEKERIAMVFSAARHGRIVAQLQRNKKRYLTEKPGTKFTIIR
jgi:hypothetical protein